MKTLEKLAKKDKTNLVTKKDGSLTKRAIEAIRDYRNIDGKFYITYTSGSGRYTTNLSNTTIIDIIRLLGYKYSTGNDSPRNGKTGDYIQVSKRAFSTIISLIK
jgi:hypothetical protein